MLKIRKGLNGLLVLQSTLPSIVKPLLKPDNVLIVKPTFSLSEISVNKFNKLPTDKLSTGLDIGNQLLTGILGEKSEYNGPKGNLTRTLDLGYDTISDAVAKIPGWGTAASLIMKVGKGVGSVVNKLGSGTDGMTTTDAILGSSFLNLTPISFINGFGGQRTDTITKDEEVLETIGGSWTGSFGKIDDALTKSGKKYGLFSSGARRDVNQEIAEAKRQQSIMTDIANEATDRFNIRNSMAAINGNRRRFYMQGGYDQSAIRVGRYGMIIKNLLEAKKINSNLEEKIINSPQSFKEGGNLTLLAEINVNNLSTEFKESNLEEVSVDNILPEFREGGKFNLIPEGALHARKHNMDVEGITSKGIPVVSDSEGGEIEQQAEIEREEIIYRIYVTKKLEDLKRKYENDNYSQEEKDQFAIEAGKLLVLETLYNTIDNAKLIDKIN